MVSTEAYMAVDIHECCGRVKDTETLNAKTNKRNPVVKFYGASKQVAQLAA